MKNFLAILSLLLLTSFSPDPETGKSKAGPTGKDLHQSPDAGWMQTQSETEKKQEPQDSPIQSKNEKPAEVLRDQLLKRQRDQFDAFQETAKGDMTLAWGLGAFIVSGVTGAYWVSRRNRARRIAGWGRANPAKARWIIAGMQILTGAGGIFWGYHLYEQGITLSSDWMYVLGGAFLLNGLTYPIRNAESRLFRHTFFRQKMHDLALVLTGFSIAVVSANHLFTGDLPMMKMAGIGPGAKTAAVRTGIEHANNQARAIYAPGNDSPESLAESQQRDLHPAVKVLLVILLTLAFAIGWIMLIVLSCSVACSGNSAGAGALLWFGTILLLALYILAMVLILKPGNRERALLNFKRRLKRTFAFAGK